MLKLALILPVAAGLSVGGVDPAANTAVSRRGAMSLLSGLSVAALGASAANAVPARTGLSSPFTGEYDDPAHPGCLRSVKVGGAPLGPDGRRKRTPVAAIRGTDGPNGGACTARPDTADVWKLSGTVAEDGSTILIDFSPKGGPKDLLGKYDEFGGVPGIVFPDGNKWTKVANGTPDRRPKDLPTLSSD